MSSFTYIFEGFYLEFKLFVIASQNIRNMYFRERISMAASSTNKFNFTALTNLKLKLLWLLLVRCFLYPFCENMNEIYHIGLETV